jgi:hypothetical protein
MGTRPVAGGAANVRLPAGDSDEIEDVEIAGRDRPLITGVWARPETAASAIRDGARAEEGYPFVMLWGALARAVSSLFER